MSQNEAAVAVIRLVRQDPLILLLERVKKEDDPWSGHVAFPGGHRETQDESILQTCIRECREETGIELNESYLIDELEPMLAGQYSSRTLDVHPFVFELQEQPEVIPDPKEVARVFWVAESYLHDPQNHESRHMVQGFDQTFPGVPIKDAFLWGFSYGVLKKYFSWEFQE